MKDWESLFGSYLNSGVHRLDAWEDEAIHEAATAAGLDFAHIDLHEVSDKAHFLTAVAGALEFPNYFGMNWDALHDCLTDLSWRPAAGYVLLLTGLRSQDERPDLDIELALSVFNSAADFWKQREVPFYIMLSE